MTILNFDIFRHYLEFKKKAKAGAMALTSAQFHPLRFQTVYENWTWNGLLAEKESRWGSAL